MVKKWLDEDGSELLFSSDELIEEAITLAGWYTDKARKMPRGMELSDLELAVENLRLGYITQYSGAILQEIISDHIEKHLPDITDIHSLREASIYAVMYEYFTM